MLSMMAAVAVMLVVTSCGDDDEVAPVLPPSIDIAANVEANEEGVFEVEAGETIALDIVVNAPAGFNVMRLSATLDGSNFDLAGAGFTTEFTRLDEGVAVNQDATRAEIDLDIATTEDFVGEWVFTFTAVDDADQTTTANVEVVVMMTEEPEGVVRYETILLGGQGSSEASSLDAITGEKYTLTPATQNSELIDIVYYWGATNNSTLASPDSQGLQNAFTDIANFPVKNSTRLLKTDLAVENFNTIETAEALRDAADLDYQDDSRGATQLAAGDVIAFRFDEDRAEDFGLIKVISVDDTNGNGTITIEVLIPASIAPEQD